MVANEPDNLDDKILDILLADVTRLEYVDYTKSLNDGGGRVVVVHNPSVKLSGSLQDGGRTLKIFIDERNG